MASYQPAVPNRSRKPGQVPSFEQCLTQILDSLHYSSKDRVVQCISPKEKQRFRQIDLHPEAISLSTYRRIIGKLLSRHLLGLKFLTKPQRRVIEEELRSFLEGYENLILQLTSGKASAQRVRWSLCVRFFVPWVALRIAFRLRHQPQEQANNEGYWFLPPISGGKIGSCFMNLVDRQIKKPGESNHTVAVRLCGKPKVGDVVRNASNLERSFRRLRLSEETGQDSMLIDIFKRHPCSRGLRSQLVLARAIDRNVQLAARKFDHKRALKLAQFFHLSFHHFRRLLFRLEEELPDDDETAWQMLQSPTLTGNTRFEADRYYPLTEPFVSRLARSISAELEGLGCRFAHVPTTKREFRTGVFAAYGWRPLPIEIEDAYRRADFSTAVTASQSMFTSKSGSAAEATRVGRLFSRAGLRAYDAAAANCALTPSESEAPTVLNEAARLFALAYSKARGIEKVQNCIKFLRFLLEPSRPKAKGERPLAWGLYRVAAKHYQQSGRGGSAAFLCGCLLWLQGNEEQALDMLFEAARAGRASCGQDWIWLLRFATILARKVSKRRLNYFITLSEREGVLYREPSPKTNIVMNELRQQADVIDFRLNFKPFPT